MKILTGKIALAAGTTRRAARGIACKPGEAGATLYCTAKGIII